MNRNAESHFATLPQADIQRSRFDRSHSVKFTGNVGQLIPFLCEPILPGDTVNITTSKILRLQTMLSPVMDNAFLDVYYFFVPNRLVWKHWKEFCGENTQSAWYPTVQYSIPKITIPGTGVKPCSLMDYLGIPPYKTDLILSPQDVNALRLRGYLLICNEWFRDQNLTDPLVLTDNDATIVYDDTTEHGGAPFVAAKMHDYFTSCLPGPQKAASPVQVPASGVLPVKTAAVGVQTDSPFFPLVMSPTVDSASTLNLKFHSYNVTGNYTYPTLGTDISNTVGYAPINLVASSTPNPTQSGYLSMSVTDLRLAFQTQKFLERQARGGSRYREIIQSHFGVTSPDARQQVPEYLGGNRVPLNINQVVNQAESADQRLGNLGAYSQTTDVHSDVFKSFTEHGYLYGLCVVRYDHTYSQGVDPDWLVNDVYDYYWPEFASISEQPVPTRAIYFQDGAEQPLANNVFGFQEAWAHYRYATNRVAGEMRPYVSNGLFSWSFADVYASRPTLSDSWIREDKANVDRTLAVSSSISNQYWADFYVSGDFTRPMPLYSIPGLVDHF